MNKKVNKYLPLTESTAYILLALEEPLHGYGPDRRHAPKRERADRRSRNAAAGQGLRRQHP